MLPPAPMSPVNDTMVATRWFGVDTGGVVSSVVVSESAAVSPLSAVGLSPVHASTASHTHRVICASAPTLTPPRSIVNRPRLGESILRRPWPNRLALSGRTDRVRDLFVHQGREMRRIELLLLGLVVVGCTGDTT